MRKGIMLVVVGLVLSMAPAAQATHAAYCYDPIITQTILHGTDGNDSESWDNPNGQCYDAKAGSDTVYSYAFIDQVLAQSGNDYVDLGNGDDSVNGGGGEDYLIGGNNADVLYGGPNADGTVDYATGQDGYDNLFGGGFCTETGFWGFGDAGDPLGTCNNDGSDQLNGGPGDDWIWESNSDNYGDGHIDDINGGQGYDICIVEEIDSVSGCEDVRIVPTRP